MLWFRLLVVLVVLFLTLLPAQAAAGDYCVFSNGSHVHVSCNEFARLGGSNPPYTHGVTAGHCHHFMVMRNGVPTMTACGGGPAPSGIVEPVVATVVDPPPAGKGGEGVATTVKPIYVQDRCVVAHAATPLQLCAVTGGLQIWYIGVDGGAHAGPYFAKNIQTTPGLLLYEGVNPLTDKAVYVVYMGQTNGVWLQVGTYYPDNEYDKDKPYVFTVNYQNGVKWIAW